MTRGPIPSHFWRRPEIFTAVAKFDCTTLIIEVRKATALSQEQVARLTGLSQSVISRIESGRLVLRDVVKIRALLDGLGAPQMVPELSSVPELEADAGTLAEQLSQTMPRDYIEAQNRGPRHSLHTASCYAHLVGHNRPAARGADRTALLKVGARVAEWLGWLLQDHGDMPAAERWTGRALEWAHDAGDPVMTAYVLFRKANLATAQGHTGRALGLARTAQHYCSLPRIQALALQQEAHVHAHNGDLPRALARLDSAHQRASLPDSDTGDETLDLDYCRPAYIELQRARCLLEPSPRQALTVLEQITAVDSVAAGDRGMLQACQARAYTASGDLDHGLQLASQALDSAVDTGSARVLTELRAIGRQIANHPGKKPVQADGFLRYLTTADLLRVDRGQRQRAQ